MFPELLLHCTLALHGTHSASLSAKHLDKNLPLSHTVLVHGMHMPSRSTSHLDQYSPAGHSLGGEQGWMSASKKSEHGLLTYFVMPSSACTDESVSLHSGHCRNVLLPGAHATFWYVSPSMHCSPHWKLLSMQAPRSFMPNPSHPK